MYGDVPLRIEFPSLFTISVSKEAWVEEVWSDLAEGGTWPPCLLRSFNDWELDMR